MLQIQLRIWLIYYQILRDDIRPNKVNPLLIAPHGLECSWTLPASGVVGVHEKCISSLIVIPDRLVVRYLTDCHHVELQLIPRSVVARLLYRRILWILALFSWFGSLFDLMWVGTHFLNVVQLGLYLHLYIPHLWYVIFKSLISLAPLRCQGHASTVSLCLTSRQSTTIARLLYIHVLLEAWLLV